MVESATSREERVMGLLASIPDPEIPVINIIELGIIRGVEFAGEQVEVTITPTYTGCPAMDMIESDIKKLLVEQGYKSPIVKTSISPAWTTDWITPEAREKLRDYGIAPPEHSSSDKRILMGEEVDVSCPHCKSDDTLLVSQFGSTPCKAQYKCNTCQEPFDYFKCI